MLLFNPAELESTRFLIEEPLSKEVERRLAAKLGDTRPVCKYFLKGYVCGMRRCDSSDDDAAGVIKPIANLSMPEDQGRNR